jgi:uncharacterized protein (TIGR03663 family)
VATASTNSRAGKPKGRWSDAAAQGNETKGVVVAAATTADAGGELTRRAWWIASASVLLVAVLVRLYQLELRPMHHDEGVNGFFLNNLMRSGILNYDPNNYHGLTLYYFTLPLARFAEHLQMLDSWVLRLVPVIFGVATVWLTLNLRRYLGAVGALAAAALLALSPGVVFFSRYFIHEMMFAFFTLGLVVAALRLYEAGGREASHADSESLPANGLLELLIILVALPAIGQYASHIAQFVLNLSGVFSGTAQFAFNLSPNFVIFGLIAVVILVVLYDGARAIYLILGAVSAALLFATKETAFISLGVLLIAWALTWGYAFIASLAAGQGSFGAREPVDKRARKKQRGKGSGAAAAAVAAGSDFNLRGFLERLGGWRRLSILFVAALCIFFSVNILFYSSFFTNPKGVADSLKAFDVWTKTGKSEFHAKPFYMYLKWLLQEESPVLALASVGALIALWQRGRVRRNRFALFAALWGFGLLAAYSLINYKTPWLALSMIVPLALVGGYAIGVIYKLNRTVAIVALALALSVCAYQTYMINFVHYDEDKYIYVYAHTKRSYVDLINEVERIAALAGTKFETPINVAAPEYWPMPWYFRNYKNVGYQGRVIQTNNEAVIIASKGQNAEVLAKNGTRYLLVKDYEMRPGVTLTLYVRRDLAGR